jgi:hypothetical protein
VAFNTTILAHRDAVWGGRQPPHLIRKDAIHEQWLGRVSRLSMMRIMARRTKASNMSML